MRALLCSAKLRASLLQDSREILLTCVLYFVICVDCLLGWLAGWFAIWSVGWLICWLVGRLVVRLVRWMVAWLIGQQASEQL